MKFSLKMVAFSNLVFFVWTCKFLLVKSSSSNEVFNQCIRNTPSPSIMRCIGQQTLSSLQMLDKMDNYTLVNGFELIRPTNGQQRTFSDFFVEDPTDFRGLLENAGTIIGQRSLQWDLSMIQPGLCLRIGPTSDSNSMLEFIIDPALDRGDRYLADEPSTARILTKQFIVPFLLGLKFNLITILPLLFAGIILLLKKAVFLGKIAMFITGVLGFGGLFTTFGQFSGVNQQQHHHVHRPFGHGGGFGSNFGSNLGGGFGQNDPLSGGYYKNFNPHLSEFATTESDPLYIDQFYNYEKKIIENKADKVFDKDTQISSTEPPVQPRVNSQRSFGWKTID